MLFCELKINEIFTDGGLLKVKRTETTAFIFDTLETEVYCPESLIEE